MTREGLSRSIAWIAHWVSIPLAILFAARPAAEALGDGWVALAERLDIQLLNQGAIGRISGGFLAIVGIPALAAGFGHGLGRIIGRLARLPSTPPAEPSIRLRPLLALAPIWGIAFAPLSFVLIPFFPTLDRLRRGLARSRPRALEQLSFFGSLLIVVQFWLCYSWIPLLSPAEVVAGWVFVVALFAALRFSNPKHAPICLAIAAIVPVLYPPFPIAPGYRLAVLAVHAVVFLVPWAFLRERLMEEAPPFLVTAFVATFLFWARIVQMYSFPSAGHLSGPVVSEVFRGENGPIVSTGFFLAQPCPGWPLVAGSREKARGLVVFPNDGGRAIQEIPFKASDHFAADCERGVVYVGNYSRGGISRLSLTGASVPGAERGPLVIDPVPFSCRLYAPWKLLLDDTRERLYVLDESDRIYSADLAGGPCREETSGRKIEDFELSEARGELYVEDAGAIRVVPIGGGEDRGSIALPGRMRWILPAAQRGKVAVTVSGQIYAIYFNAGTVAKIRREPLSVESTTRLTKGIRRLLWDEKRKVLYVGNYVTGDLFALDGDDLRVLGSCQVGRRMRTLSLSPDGGSLTLCSAVGGIRVNLDALLGRSK